MTEWKDFLESLPEDTALAIELTMALDECVKLLCRTEYVFGDRMKDIKLTLNIGQEFMSKYVR